MPSQEQLESALRFYKNAPDGQYDADVVVPLIEAELVRRSTEAWGSVIGEETKAAEAAAERAHARMRGVN